jgi:hypothetical protein
LFVVEKRIGNSAVQLRAVSGLRRLAEYEFAVGKRIGNSAVQLRAVSGLRRLAEYRLGQRVQSD